MGAATVMGAVAKVAATTAVRPTVLEGATEATKAKEAATATAMVRAAPAVAVVRAVMVRVRVCRAVVVRVVVRAAVVRAAVRMGMVKEATAEAILRVVTAPVPACHLVPDPPPQVRDHRAPRCHRDRLHRLGARRPLRRRPHQGLLRRRDRILPPRRGLHPRPRAPGRGPVSRPSRRQRQRQRQRSVPRCDRVPQLHRQPATYRRPAAAPRHQRGGRRSASRVQHGRRP